MFVCVCLCVWFCQPLFRPGDDCRGKREAKMPPNCVDIHTSIYNVSLNFACLYLHETYTFYRGIKNFVMSRRRQQRDTQDRKGRRRKRRKIMFKIRSKITRSDSNIRSAGG